LAKFIVFLKLNSSWNNYEQIGGSPLLILTKKLISALKIEMPDLYVTYAMRYTEPTALDCIQNLKNRNIKKVILLPLYPQYSTTTTKSSLDEFLSQANDSFEVEIVEPFYKNVFFNEAICESISKKIKNPSLYHLIFSAHGLPQKIIDSGDSYQEDVENHVCILKELLLEYNLCFKSISLAYQSKVGPGKWTTPSLDDSLRSYKHQNVVIFPLSFVIDNSETKYELAIEYKELAKKYKIQQYVVCDCLNDDKKLVKAIKKMVKY
jgi:ferrochelatase